MNAPDELVDRLDAFDRDLLSLIRRRVPLVREPFAQIAGVLGCAQRRVLDRIASLRRGVIREISGIFDVSRLGYDQALVAFAVDPDRLDETGAIVSAHPGVSHCYARTAGSSPFNLWFTLAVSPRSTLGLAGTAERLEHLSAAARHMLLPSLRRYKLHVDFDACTPADGPLHAEDPGAPPGAAAGAPTDAHIRAIQALQTDLPGRADPFSPLAEAAGMDADELLVCAADLLAGGWMRRYSAVLNHRAMGAIANVLVAWRASAAAAETVGARCAGLPAVSHCYVRPAPPGWPYSLYTMIHGRDRRDCLGTIEQLASAAALRERIELWTTKEYRKRRVRLFSSEQAAWEARTGAE